MGNIDIRRYLRFAKEGSRIVVGQIVTFLGSMVLVRVLTERLDPTQYGWLALALTFASLVNQVAIGGIVAGIGRFYSVAAENCDLGGYLRAAKQLMSYAALVVGGCGFAVLAGLSGAGRFQWTGLGVAVVCYSLLTGCNSALNSIQNAARQRAVVALHGGLDAWMKIGLALGLMVWLGNTSTAVVAGYTLSALIVVASQLHFLRRLVQRHAAGTGKGTPWKREIWKYSWPMVTGGLFNWGYFASQRWALQLFASTGEVGQFYALTQVAYTPIGIAGGVALSFLTPIFFAKAGDARDTGRLRGTQSAIVRTAVAGLVLTLAFALLSVFVHRQVFGLLVAPEYRSISGYMPFVVLSAGILQVSIVTASILTVEKRTVELLPLAIYGNLVITVMNLTFTKFFGVNGLVASMVAGSLLHLVWMVLIALRRAKQLVC